MRLPKHMWIAVLALAATAWLSSPAQAAPCGLQAQEATIANVNVTPANEKAFSLQVEKVPIMVTPDTEGQASLLVQGPLRFTTKHNLNRVGVRFAKKTSLLDGRIVIAKGAAPYFPQTEPESPTQSELDSGHIRVHFPLSELTLKAPIIVPCNVFTISNTDDHNPTQVISSEPHAHVAGGTTITLYARPERVAPFSLNVHGPMRVIAETPSWVRLQAKWSDGSSLQGWVVRAEVKVQTGALPKRVRLLGTTGLGMCGRSHGPRLVTLRIHDHAPIHTGPGGAIWARAAGNIVVQAFGSLRADGWIAVAELKGFPTSGCSEHNKIWVHSRHILWDES